MGKPINYEVKYNEIYGYYRDFSKSIKTICEVNNHISLNDKNVTNFDCKQEISNDNDIENKINDGLCDNQLNNDLISVYNKDNIFINKKEKKYNYFHKIYNKDIIYYNMRYKSIIYQIQAYGNAL